MTALWACLVSLSLTVICGKPLIERLRALALAQHAYEDAPQTHQKKTGTPTMGGLLFLAAIVVALLMSLDQMVIALSILTLSCGAVGAVDDLASIRKARNKGLSAKAKFAATIAAAATFLGLVAYWHLTPITHLSIPAIALPVVVWMLLSGFVILASTHAVNLTDGLDGLAGGTMVPPLVFCSWFAWVHGFRSIAIFDMALLGAVFGFLVYNRHPAKVFMGDTGALALGGALAGSMILLGFQLILPILGLVFVAEALSVILQVASYKTTKRRIFKMSPLHHHFELCGMTETRVTLAFWSVSLLSTIAALFAVGEL